MTRKLLLLMLTVLTAWCFSTAAASAVIVENPGEIEIASENNITLHTIRPTTPPVELTAIRCAEHFHGSIDEAGHIDLDDVRYEAHSGSTGNCNNTNDCDNAGFEAQIEEDHAHWEYSVHITTCIEGQGGPLDGVPVVIECKISNTEIHCGGTHDGIADEEENEAFVRNIQVAPGVILPFFVEGEMTITNPLGLMHEDI